MVFIFIAPIFWSTSFRLDQPFLQAFLFLLPSASVIYKVV